MGIPVVSSIPASPSGNAASAQLPAESGGRDFAALLTRQLFSAPPGLPEQARNLLPTGMAADSLPAPQATEDASTTASPQDAAAILAAAGFLPAFMVPAKPSPTATVEIPRTGQNPIGEITTQPDLKSGKNQGLQASDTSLPADPASFLVSSQEPEGNANTPGDTRIAEQLGQRTQNSGKGQRPQIIDTSSQIQGMAGQSAPTPSDSQSLQAATTTAQPQGMAGQPAPPSSDGQSLQAATTIAQIQGMAGQPAPPLSDGQSLRAATAQTTGSADQPAPNLGKGQSFEAIGITARSGKNAGQPASDPSVKQDTQAIGIPSKMTEIADPLTPNSGKDQAFTAADSGSQAASTHFLSTNMAADKTANIAADIQPAGSPQNFSATLSAQSAMTRPVQPRNAPAETTTEISTPLHDSHWPQDLSSKVVWLAKTDQQVAQININPPQLGPMHITLSLNGDQASAVFTSPHAEVRQVITDAMPHLREMLAGAGINLGQANVGTQLPQQQQNGNPSRFSNPLPSGDDKAILRADGAQDSMATLSTVRRGRGMVDLFA